MDIVKKNAVNIAIGVVALIAIVALFVPVGGMFSDLDERLRTRKGDLDTANGLKSQTRQLPTVVETGEPQTLDQFPSPALIEQAKRVTADVSARAKLVFQQALAINQGNLKVDQFQRPLEVGHVLLEPNALPTPADETKFRFRHQYNMMLWIPERAEENPPGSIAQILGSTPPATEEEIRKELVKVWVEKYKPQIWETEVAGTKTFHNVDKTWSNFVTEQAGFERAFRTNRAAKYKIYMENGALSVSPKMDQSQGQGTLPSPEDVWYAQTSFWAQRGVAQAIAKVNARATNVYNAPVKHVIALTLRPGLDMYHQLVDVTGGGGALSAPMPAPPPPNPDGTTVDTASDPNAAGDVPPKKWNRSPTGRVCNSMYDVVHSYLTVVVDPLQVEPLLRALEAGNFVTVLEVDEQAIDGRQAKADGYDYGPGPVVRLQIQLEHLYMRKWTAYDPDAPMPQMVQQRLGVKKPAPPPTDGTTITLGN